MPDPTSSAAAGRTMELPPVDGIGEGLPAGMPSPPTVAPRFPPPPAAAPGQTTVPLSIVVAQGGGEDGGVVSSWPIAIGTRINIARKATVARKVALFIQPSFSRCVSLATNIPKHGTQR